MEINWHFTFFMINLLGFVFLGVLMAQILRKSLKRFKRVSAINLFVVAILASILGGLLGFLANGMPEIGIAHNNLMTALVASIAGVSVLRPQKIHRSKIEN